MPGGGGGEGAGGSWAFARECESRGGGGKKQEQAKREGQVTRHWCVYVCGNKKTKLEFYVFYSDLEKYTRK